MSTYIQKANGQMAGSIGDGRDTIPTPSTTVPQPRQAAESPATLAEAIAALTGDLFALVCRSCGSTFSVLEAETQAAAAGWRVDCDRCTDPALAMEYGLGTCQECGSAARDCSCVNGPLYCTADGCANNRGDLDDDGSCELCGEVADSVVQWGGEFLHVCDSCDASDEEMCDQCGDTPRSEDSDLCAYCLDNKTIAETGHDMYGRPTAPCVTCGEGLDQDARAAGSDFCTRCMNAEYCDTCRLLTCDDACFATGTCFDGPHCHCEIGQCDHCPTRFDNGGDDHCGECGNCFDHCTCPPGDVDVTCETCGSLLGHGSPEAAWTCRACAILADANAVTVHRAFTVEEQAQLSRTLTALLAAGPAADPGVQYQRQEMLRSLSGEPGFCAFHDAGMDAAPCSCPSPKGRSIL